MATAVVLGVLVLFAMREIGSPDAGFHLATGRAMLAGEGWPRFDRFTYTVTAHPYVDTSWGYDVVLALVESALGAPGLVALHAGLVVLAFALVAATARLAGADPRSLLALLLLGGVAAEERFEVRPELLSYAFLALVLYVLSRHAEGRRAPLSSLLPIFLVWSNSHSLFIVGWVVLACFVAGSWLERRRLDRKLLGWSAACVAIALVNPYGLQALRFTFILATRLGAGHVFGGSIGEYESPFRTIAGDQLGFYLVPVSCLLAFVVVVLASVVPLARQRRFTAVLLAAVFVPLALSMVRNAPLVVIACLPGAARALPLGRLLEVPALCPDGRRRVERAVTLAVLLVAVLLGLRVFHDAYYVGHGRLERFGWGWNRLRLPVDAVAWLERARPQGRMLNDYNFGGHLIWTLGHPVFIDGRNEVVGEEFYAYWMGIMASPPALEAAVARWSVRWAVFPYRDRTDFFRMLSGDPRWRLSYFDHQAAIFARADGAASLPVDARVARLLQQAPPAVDLAGVPGLGGVPLRSTWGGWLSGFFRRQTYPVEHYAQGVFHYLRGDWVRLASHTAEAIRQSGRAYPELYQNLGASLWALGRPAESRRCFEIALEAIPLLERARRRGLEGTIGDIDRALGRR